MMKNIEKTVINVELSLRFQRTYASTNLSHLIGTQRQTKWLLRNLTSHIDDEKMTKDTKKKVMR